MVLKTLQELPVMEFYCKCKWIIEIKLSFNCVNSCSSSFLGMEKKRKEMLLYLMVRGVM
jgi:hypothetical protein